MVVMSSQAHHSTKARPVMMVIQRWSLEHGRRSNANASEHMCLSKAAKFMADPNVVRISLHFWSAPQSQADCNWTWTRP